MIIPVSWKRVVVCCLCAVCKWSLIGSDLALSISLNLHQGEDCSGISDNGSGKRTGIADAWLGLQIDASVTIL